MKYFVSRLLTDDSIDKLKKTFLKYQTTIFLYGILSTLHNNIDANQYDTK